MAEEEVETLRNWRRRWREANPEKQKASEKRWQEENRELHLKSKIKRQAKRRAQAVSSGGEFTAEDIDAMLAAQKKKCWYCGTKLRSEEHTSELQSLMHISYGDLCLKKTQKSNKRHLN